jgi:hypothetical protein
MVIVQGVSGRSRPLVSIYPVVLFVFGILRAILRWLVCVERKRFVCMMEMWGGCVYKMSVCRCRRPDSSIALRRPQFSVMLGSSASDRLSYVQVNLEGDIYKCIQHNRWKVKQWAPNYPFIR